MILQGTKIVLADGKSKPVEKLRVGAKLMAHDGTETTLQEVVPLRSKKNTCLTFVDRTHVVLHHDQLVLTNMGWLRTRMLRVGDNLVLFRKNGGGSASVLWGESEREWLGRLAKVDFRTVNMPPWPSCLLKKLAIKVEIARALSMPVDAKARKDPTLCMGYDLITSGGFVMQVSRGPGYEPMAFICRDASKFIRPARVRDPADYDDDEDDEGEEDDEDEGPKLAA